MEKKLTATSSVTTPGRDITFLIPIQYFLKSYENDVLGVPQMQSETSESKTLSLSLILFFRYFYQWCDVFGKMKKNDMLFYSQTNTFYYTLHVYENVNLSKQFLETEVVAIHKFPTSPYTLW